MARMRIQKNYCSYIPALMKALQMVDGDVLELGAGLHSTMFLHWMCLHQGRSLVTYENDQRYYDMVRHCEGDKNEIDFHKVIFVKDWDEIDIEKSWGIAFVDHAPGIRRNEEIKRLANYAQCLVVHDARWRTERIYHYSEIYPLFKYKHPYGSVLSQTILLSNYVDVSKWT